MGTPDRRERAACLLEKTPRPRLSDGPRASGLLPSGTGCHISYRIAQEAIGQHPRIGVTRTSMAAVEIHRAQGTPFRVAKNNDGTAWSRRRVYGDLAVGHRVDLESTRPDAIRLPKDVLAISQRLARRYGQILRLCLLGGRSEVCQSILQQVFVCAGHMRGARQGRLWQRGWRSGCSQSQAPCTSRQASVFRPRRAGSSRASRSPCMGETPSTCS